MSKPGTTATSDGPAMNSGSAGSATDSPVPALVARIYAQSATPTRAKLIACLLGAVGPLAMVALSEGRFARFLFRPSTSAIAVSTEEALQFTESHVFELARYVVQASPAIFLRVAELLQTENPLFARSLAGGLLLLTLRAWMNRPHPPPPMPSG
jgi:hypothetical protein